MTTVRLAIISIALCGFGYNAMIAGFARLANPRGAEESLVESADGRIVGCRLIAQSFTSSRYFHPRPSACDYDACAASGSNLSPTHPSLAARAAAIVSACQASAREPIPADLVTASGSGLDPDITEAAARFQAARIARARGMDPAAVVQLIDKIKRPVMGHLGGPMLVNVLELNLALDRSRR